MSIELEEQNTYRTKNVAQYLQSAFDSIGLKTNTDPHLSNTAENVANFLSTFFQPYLQQENLPTFNTFPSNELYGQLVIAKELPYYSMCAHHLVPFFGVAHIGYVIDKIGIGISVPAKLLHYYSRRPQLQERLAVQVADQLVSICSPLGVIVVLTARQMCMEMRGEHTQGIIEVTTQRGCFEEEKWQKLFLSRL